MHCTRRNVRIPPDPVRPPQLPSSSRHYGGRCVCCYPRHCPPPLHHPSLVTTVPPVKRVTRSPQRNLTHNTHTHYSHVAAVHQTHTHTYIYLYTHVCVHHYTVVVTPTPRHGHVVGTKVPCIALLAYRVVPLPSPLRATNRSLHTHVTATAHAVLYRGHGSALLERARIQTANVYNRVLPGTCSPPRLRIKL